MLPQSSRRGWCPTAALGMEAADGFLLRVRPTAGRLCAHELRQLAWIAGGHGNGAVVLTRRGKLELRGIRDADAAARALRDAGLAPADPAAEARPDVIASPASDLDDLADADVGPLARELDSALACWPRSRDLPAKLAAVVDGGGRGHVAHIDGDLRFDAVRRDGAVRYRVALAGTRDSATPLGDCAAASVPAVARALLERFHELREGNEYRVWRMRHALAFFGAGELSAAVAGFFEPWTDDKPPVPIFGSALGEAGGWHGAAFPFGRLDQDTLEGLADLAERWGHGDVRVLPTRSVLIGGLDRQAAVALRDLGAIDRAGDPRLRIEACSGLGGCAHATTATRHDALKLSERVPGLLGGSGHCMLHVSGCAKGCAHSGAAPVTLTGREGRYDICLGSAPGTDPLWQGLDVDEAGQRLAALERVLVRLGRSGERPERALAELDRDRLREQVEQELGGG